MPIFSLIPEKLTNIELLSTNCAFAHHTDYLKICGNKELDFTYITKNSSIIMLKQGEVEEGKIMMSSIHRNMWRAPLDGSSITFTSRTLNEKASSVIFMVKFMGKVTTISTINSTDLMKGVNKHFINLPISIGYELALVIGDNSLILKVKDIIKDNISVSSEECLLISNTTKFNFQSEYKEIKLIGENVILPTSATAKAVKRIISDSTSEAEALGIGGLDKEFKDILRRAFVSRMYPSQKLKDIGITHVKGMLLYGPPGTGKTLTAKTIGKLLNARPPKMISGPELLDKYVGGSEQKIRDLFSDAYQEWKEKEDSSELHIIIIDELDAVCKQRGSKSDNTGTLDSMVNQLLAMMDGPEAPGNILVIGMTNRKELIDKALLRPGRFEVHLTINLPNEEGRESILKIHTKKLKENNSLSDDVDIKKLAKDTPNFSGAELAGLVRSATSFAMERDKDKNKDIIVNSDDFIRALKEVKAGYGSNDREILELSVRFGFLEATDYRSIIQRVIEFGNTILNGSMNNGSLLLSASSPGSGCSAICYEIIKSLKCEFVSVISAAQLVKKTSTEPGQVEYISQIFEDAHQVPRAVIILDGLESIIQYIPIGFRFSSSIMKTITAHMSDPSSNGNKIIVIATTADKQAMENIGFINSFDEIYEIPSLTPEQAFNVLSEYANLDKVDYFVANVRADIVQVDYDQFRTYKSLKEKYDNGGILTIKKLMLMYEKAKEKAKENSTLKITDVLMSKMIQN